MGSVQAVGIFALISSQRGRRTDKMCFWSTALRQASKTPQERVAGSEKS